MEVTIKFNVESLEEIQPSLVRGGENLVRSLQTENQRLRDKINALECAVLNRSGGGSEEPAVGDRDAEGTPFDPAKHSGTKTQKGAWRAKRASKEVPTGEVIPAAKAPEPATVAVGLDAFRTAVLAVVNAHPDGADAGKAFARKIMAKYGAEAMGKVDPKNYAAIIAELNASADAESGDGADDLDGL